MKRKVKALNLDSRSPIDGIDPIADHNDCNIIYVEIVERQYQR